MTQTTIIADLSPELFLNALVDKVKDGFYADDSVVGWPHFNAINEMTLFKSAKPELRNDLSKINTVLVEGYCNATFILDVQDAVLQGFVVEPETTVFGAPHSVVLKRKGAQKATQATVESEPVGEPTEEAETASESVTEAVEEKTQQKQTRGRPSKSKE